MASPRTEAGCSKTLTVSSVLRFQILSRPSSPAVARKSSLPKKCDDQTTPPCASKVDCTAFLGQSHSRTVPSSTAIATVSLAGSKATDHTEPELAARTATGSAEETGAV